MSQIVQLSLSDLEKIFRKIAGKEKPFRPVSLKRAKEITGMSDWEIRKAVETNPAIKKGANKYDLQLLKIA